MKASYQKGFENKAPENHTCKSPSSLNNFVVNNIDKINTGDAQARYLQNCIRQYKHCE